MSQAYARAVEAGNADYGLGFSVGFEHSCGATDWKYIQDFRRSCIAKGYRDSLHEFKKRSRSLFEGVGFRV